MLIQWGNGVRTRSYDCGWCGNRVASSVGYHSSGNTAIRICQHCGYPTIFQNDYLDKHVSTIPAKRLGRDIEGMPDDVKRAYNEARDCLAHNAPTAAAMLCRKLLMHIAVSKGAKENLKYIEYVNFLKENGYIPPDGKEWADRVRSIGNEANHELKPINRANAEDILSFIELLLKFIYEWTYLSKQKADGKGK